METSRYEIIDPDDRTREMSAAAGVAIVPIYDHVIDDVYCYVEETRAPIMALILNTAAGLSIGRDGEIVPISRAVPLRLVEPESLPPSRVEQISEYGNRYREGVLRDRERMGA